MENKRKHPKFFPEGLIIEEDALETELTKHLLRELHHVPVRTFMGKIDDPHEKEAYKRVSGLTNNQLWIIRKNRGPFIKHCPGTARAICCGYSIANIILGCPMECTYCVLQGYLNTPFLTIYANPEDLLDEIGPFINKRGDTLCRLGTGELTDSLALDPLTLHSRLLIPYFSRRKDAILELKTKTDFVEHILDLSHGFRTVISWSLNPEKVIAEEEMKTATLDERIDAAFRCQKVGYPIGLHFDPMIWYQGWEDDYRELISRIFEKIDPEGVIWVSLGTLRFPPYLKPAVRRRWPDTRILLGELFPGLDGKMRYLKVMRIEMYRKMVGWLKSYHGGLFIYLCMETDEVWNRVFGWSPISMDGLDRLFDSHTRDFLNRWESMQGTSSGKSSWPFFEGDHDGSYHRPKE